MDILIISEGLHFSDINAMNERLFSGLTCFGKLSYFHFHRSFLSSDTFRSIVCIGCTLIFLADIALHFDILGLDIGLCFILYLQSTKSLKDSNSHLSLEDSI